jgi:hypothetical protein
LEYGYYRSNQQLDMQHQEHNIQGHIPKLDKTRGKKVLNQQNYEDDPYEEEKLTNNSQGYNN